MDTSILQEFVCMKVCLIRSQEKQRILKKRYERMLDFLYSLGIFSLGFNPTNQTITIGKNPNDFNPREFLYKSFESKRPLEL